MQKKQVIPILEIVANWWIFLSLRRNSQTKRVRGEKSYKWVQKVVQKSICVSETQRSFAQLSFLSSSSFLLLLLLLNVEEQESIYSIRFFGPNKKGGRKGPILVGKVSHQLKPFATIHHNESIRPIKTCRLSKSRWWSVFCTDYF